VVTLRCMCEHKYKVWGELWWVGSQRKWMFYDDLEPSETYYAKGITHCPACGLWLERKNLKVHR
jgi:hypothetical protein